MVVNTSDNRWATSNFIVAPTLAEGAGYTTIAAALTAASSGNTIFIKPGTYTENLTLKAGVNLCAFDCDSSLNGTGHVIISGNATLTAAGSVTISGIQLQTNSAAFLTVSGSAASIVNLDNCYLNCTNNTGISFSSSSSSSMINIYHCTGNIGTTGISLIVSTSTGNCNIHYTNIENTGSSSTTSSASAGTISLRHSFLTFPITTTGTGTITFTQSQINCTSTNSTCLTHGGSTGSTGEESTFFSGSASAISVGGTMQISNCTINSTNTNAITGAGTLIFAGLNFTSSGFAINTTTQTAQYHRPGISLSAQQPAFLAQADNQTDVTGDNTNYTVTFVTEIFDQHSDFSSPTFTAPFTGRYNLSCTMVLSNIGAAHTSANITISTSNRAYLIFQENATAVDAAGALAWNGSMLCDMDASDTATIVVNASGSTKTVDIAGGAGFTYFSGIMEI